MAVLLETIKDHFVRDEWDIHPLGDGIAGLQTGFKGDQGEWTCIAVVLESTGHFMFYSVCPVQCPENLRTVMGEFLHRANHGLNLGNFEFDLTDGDIRFKTSVCIARQSLNHEVFQTLVHHNVLVMDEYLVGIYGIIEQGMTSEAAITTVETPAVGDA